LHQPERDVKVVKSADMNYVEREQVIQIHPDDAVSANITDGANIVVKSESGMILASGRAVLNSPQTGLVGTTTLFGELATQMHEIQISDWAPHMPGLGLENVRLELAPVETQSRAVAD